MVCSSFDPCEAEVEGGEEEVHGEHEDGDGGAEADFVLDEGTVKGEEGDGFGLVAGVAIGEDEDEKEAAHGDEGGGEQDDGDDVAEGGEGLVPEALPEGGTVDAAAS